MLLVFGAPCQLPSLAGQEHGRTIPLTDLAAKSSMPASRYELPQRLKAHVLMLTAGAILLSHTLA